MGKLKVMITGAAGRIGSVLVGAFEGRYDLRLVDRRPISGHPDTVVADTTDGAAMRAACEGQDVVLHLAANASSRASFDELLEPNIIGPYRVFQAACDAKVRRMIFASSCHAVRGYPRDAGVTDADPPNPPDIYGVTKVYGEVLGKYFHEQHGMEFIGCRIGAFQPSDSKWAQKGDAELRALWLCPDDAVDFFQRAIEKPGIGYAVLNVVSVCEPQWLSLEPSKRVLGHEPKFNVSDLPGPAS